MNVGSKVYEVFEDKRLGLALSGGGYRAAVFHLGILAFIAENNLLEKVTHISTVSGGSIVMGLIYRLNNFKWPTSKEYLDNIHEQAINYLKTTSLLKDNMKWRAFIGSISNGLFVSHEKMLYELKTTWELDKDIQELDDSPIWTINATAGETGKSWRIQKSKMGDYKLGQIENPNITLADAIAASAGFPFAIGPLVLDLTKYGYRPKELYVPGSGDFPRERVTLYDGGLYDNLGTEVFFGGNFSKFPDSIDFLIVSDASKHFQIKKDMFSLWHFGKLSQLSDVATEQIRSLRIRMLNKLIQKKNQPNLGIHIRLGDTELGLKEEAECAKSIDTDLKRLLEREIECLINNGFDAASKNFDKYLKRLEELNAMKEIDELV